MSRSCLIRSILLSILLSVMGSRTNAERLFNAPNDDSAAPNTVIHTRPIQAPSEGSAAPNPVIHTRLNGKPCIDLKSRINSEIVNKNLFEHWISATNSCGQHIKLQVCYHQTNDCIVMTVPPYESKNSVLGIQPNMRQFQYDAKEK